MNEFSVALSNVAVALLYLLPGFLVMKAGKMKEEHLKGMSSLLIYGCTPCMMADALMNLNGGKEDLLRMLWFFIISFAAQGIFMFLVGSVFKKKTDMVRMLQIDSVMGNVGFFGLPVVRAMFPDHPEAAAYSITFCVSMNIFAFTIGVFNLTGDKKYISLKEALINPSVISFAAGLLLCLSKAQKWIPSAAQDGIALMGRMTTPLCMMILGARLATMPVKEILLNPAVYGISLSKLVLFPLFSYLLVVFLPLDPVFKASVLVLSATPCASIVLNLAEIHSGGQKLAADCVLLSTLMCVFTLPLLTLIIS